MIRWRHDTGLPARRARPAALLSIATALAAAACDVSSAPDDAARARGADTDDVGAGSPGPAPPALDVAAAPEAGDWCGEHGLPESMCTKCHPELTAGFQEAGDWCGEHGYPESACPLCNPRPPPPGAEVAAIEGRTVRLRTAELEAVAGLETVPATRGRAAAAVECTARLAFDADRVADVRALVPGVVRRMHAGLGDAVEAGAPLFTLESTRVGEIQGTLATARERVRAAEAHLARQRALRERDVASARDVELAARDLASAEAEARTAEATLRMAGAPRSTPAGRYVLRAPLAGTVVRRPAVVGLLATEETSLAIVADTSTMWALCDVPEARAGRIAVGQRVAVRFDDGGAAPAAGTLAWVAAEVDPRTRTVAARAELPNPEGRLRANQFARARIEVGAPRGAVLVPRDAVQRVGAREVVFVRTAPGVYAPRVVERHGDGAQVPVVGRVSVGDPVVTTGAVLLRTEVMPGSIGAGCCDVEPPGGD